VVRGSRCVHDPELGQHHGRVEVVAFAVDEPVAHLDHVAPRDVHVPARGREAVELPAVGAVRDELDHRGVPELVFVEDLETQVGEGRDVGLGDRDAGVRALVLDAVRSRVDVVGVVQPAQPIHLPAVDAVEHRAVQFLGGVHVPAPRRVGARCEHPSAPR
jgi:hypothetical protein